MISNWNIKQAKVNKGEYNGDCNVTACGNNKARWYNHSTRKYYCGPCARRINSDRFNAQYAAENLGHELCTPGINKVK